MLTVYFKTLFTLWTAAAALAPSLKRKAAFDVHTS